MRGPLHPVWLLVLTQLPLLLEAQTTDLQQEPLLDSSNDLLPTSIRSFRVRRDLY